MKKITFFLSLVLLTTACGTSEINRAADALAGRSCFLIENPGTAVTPLPAEAKTALNNLYKSPDVNLFKVSLRTALQAKCGKSLEAKNIDVNQMVDALTRVQD